MCEGRPEFVAAMFATEMSFMTAARSAISSDAISFSISSAVTAKESLKFPGIAMTPGVKEDALALSLLDIFSIERGLQFTEP